MTAPLRRAALFDLDRTLVRVNTATLYMLWQYRRGEATSRDVAQAFWWVAQYTLGMVDAERLAVGAAAALAGRDEAAFRALLRDWVLADVVPLVGTVARTEVARRRDAGFVCGILTSATYYSADPLAEVLAIPHVLASPLAVTEGRFTGVLGGALCYGPGKVLAAERWAADQGVDLARSAFFTDSISDLPMLERVGEPVVVNPDPRLRWVAARRGWAVQRW